MQDRQERINKTLILTQTDPETDMMFKNWIQCGLHADILFNDIPKSLRAVRRVAINAKLPSTFYGIWLRKSWVRDIMKYDTFIIHAGDWTRNIATFIHSINQNARIIYWYWNVVNPLSTPNKVRDKNVEFWTFDPNDANKYGMKLNIQYYSPIKVNHVKSSYDIYYVGHDRGRGDKVRKFENQVKSLGLTTRFDLIPDNGRLIPYEEVCGRILKSKAILEINQSVQVGYTLRTMESLFMEKKLITDNPLTKKLDFYNPNNIFIWDGKNTDEVPTFLKQEYDTSVNKFKAKYDIFAWFENFFN